ncbi:MAG: rhodanese-like domain-containing protein [Promethearchaeota archaeon]
MPTLKIIFDISTHKELRKIYFNQHEVPQISSLSLSEQRGNSNTTIIDVRYPKEFVKLHINDSINIPMTDIFKDRNIMGSFIDNNVVFVCTNGNRSKFVTQFLIEQANFTRVSNLEGGLNKWFEVS